MGKQMPAQHPGKSEQVVCTPQDFLTAVKSKLGISQFDIDLAADETNTASPTYYSEEMNSLIQPWKVGDGWNWCNPPFSDLKDWVAKASMETFLGTKTAMLVPASVGANWWYNFVDGDAHVLFLNGRLTFIGHTSPYPKDLALLLYTHTIHGGYEVWNWRHDVR